MQKLIKSGIPGLDNILGGGLLQGSIVAISGPTGSGKSTMALQFLYSGATQLNEPGMYISIEESRQDIFFHMGGYNWDFTTIEKERRFVLLDYPVHEVDQILNQYSAIQEIINTTGVKRVVIDSIMPIALFFQNEDERKKGFLKLIENIRKWNVTTLIISEDVKATSVDIPPNTTYGIESFADGWINLFYVYDEKKMERVRLVEVLKMKGVPHSSKAHPAVIDRNGFSLVEQEKPKLSASKPTPAAKVKKSK